jgi:hypothetical protein
MGVSVSATFSEILRTKEVLRNHKAWGVILNVKSNTHPLRSANIKTTRS